MEENQQPPDAPARRHGHDFLTHILGGIIAWGLIGLGLDYLLHTSGIAIAGALLGAAGGFFLARFQQRRRREGLAPHQ
jgi:uncharacterized membrane protein